VQAQHGLEALTTADTVVVPGYLPLDDPGERVCSALRQAAARGARMVSVCTDAFALAAADLRHGFAERIGTDERTLADTPVLDPARTVRTDVNRVLWAEEIPRHVHVSGHVYDVATGLVTTIVDARARK
jgi:carbonic anhydrase